MSSPSISITIPVYNEEKIIRKCLDSIKRQKYNGNIEVIVVDNGCVDKTIKIAREYKFVTVLKNSENDYLSAKMLGLRKTKAKYYTYLDADIDLPTKYWVEKMVRPLEEDKTIVASITGFVSYKSDPNLNKYLTLDNIQRDPLFVFLTPGVDSFTPEKRKGYELLIFEKNKILPMGLCVYRRNDLLKIPEIAKRNKFYELDNLVILVNKGLNKFAFVENAGLHHLTVKNLKSMLLKRIRNLRKTFFVKGEKRHWNWIDTSDRKSIIKLLFWVIYSETIFLPFLYGIIRSIKHKSLLGLYEPIIVWLTTNVILYVFITSSGGRRFIMKLID